MSTRVGGFRTVDPEGTVTQGNDIIGNGYGCLPEGSAIATDVRAGEKAEGTIIIDVPSAEGVIILPDLLGQSEGIQGWEWAYSAACSPGKRRDAMDVAHAPRVRREGDNPTALTR